jgi:hypothetical protein
MSNKFSTLLLREWMQHKRGWIATILLPPALFLVILPFGQMHFDGGAPTDHPLLAGLAAVMMTSWVLFFISAISVALQLTSLARRDVQDRSIEFWLSLPASHVQSLSATLLAHTLLVPLVALVAGFGLGFVVAPAMALKVAGPSGLTLIPWGQVAALGLPLLLRWVFGVLLAALWVAPLVMIVMATSAWLKRWSIPALVGALIFSIGILPKAYGITALRNWLVVQVHGAVDALTFNPESVKPLLEPLAQGHDVAVGTWVLQDALQEVQHLASPNLLIGLALAAAGFALLVLRRSRAG